MQVDLNILELFWLIKLVVIYSRIAKGLQLMQSILDIYKDLSYNKGFGNAFATEALPGAIPQGQNSPVKLKHGVFPEQLSGTAFTVKRAENQKVWYYKIRPSAVEGQYQKSKFPFRIVGSYLQKENISYHPNQLRWRPVPSPKESTTFVEGLTSLMGAGQPSLKQGISIYAYSANKSMDKTAFYNSDGDFLIVPHSGTLYVRTLNGRLTVAPKEILVIPRGIKFSIDVTGEIKGWVAEVFGHHFGLPELGPIGANGMANPGDFEFPTAWFEDKKQEWIIYNKYIGEMFQAKCKFSPYDVVGWKGNYSPFKYNLELYNTIGSISYDHPDPSIFTVMTVKSAMEGTATLDFVVFPPRWLVAEHTFKPPYYHRNCMSEFMGNIAGEYDAKGEGFGPGCSSLHSTMTPHGPDSESYQNFVKSEQKPYKTKDGSFSFMFESGYLLKTTTFALDGFVEVEKDYYKCWEHLSEVKFASE